MFTRVRQLQDEAEMAYTRLPQGEAAPYLQASMLAEIALQLAALSKRQEKQNELLQRIAVGIECLENLK